MRDEKRIQGDNWKKILTASDSKAESFVIQPSAVVTKADHQLYFSGDHKSVSFWVSNLQLFLSVLS